MKDEDIARVLQIGRATVERVRRRCVEEGLERALGRKEQLNRRQKRLDGQGEAHLIALGLRRTAGGPGELDAEVVGRPAGRMRDSGEHPPRDGVQDAQKNELKPWLKECWCIPPQGSAEFVCAMEDVLEVYQRRYEDNEVLVCLDETSKQQSLPSATTGGERDAPAASGPAWGGGLLRL